MVRRGQRLGTLQAFQCRKVIILGVQPLGGGRREDFEELADALGPLPGSGEASGLVELRNQLDGGNGRAFNFQAPRVAQLLDPRHELWIRGPQGLRRPAQGE